MEIENAFHANLFKRKNWPMILLAICTDLW
jgi:hypothetical protein